MALQPSFTAHYLSIQDILATNERVPCKFINELPRMGFLDPSSDNEHLAAGTSLELPYWLAETLLSKRPPMITADLPRVYKEAYREILKADASMVDLHKLGMFYYDFGSYLTSLDPRGEVGKSLVLTFRNRFRYIMDLSQNSRPDPKASGRLERLELSLLAVGLRSNEALQEWCTKTVTPLQPAPMLSTHLKRKRAIDAQE